MAAMGTALTEGQLKELGRLAKRLWLGGADLTEGTDVWLVRLTVSIEREAGDRAAAGFCVGPQSDPGRLTIGNSAPPTG